MPLYEYQCDSCKKVLEVMQKFSDAPLDACPECGGPVAKLMSMSSFALKGSGWYTTDYKRKSSGGGSGESSSSGSSGSASGSGGNSSGSSSAS
jgi:putative FmdB family regulatory protein